MSRAWPYILANMAVPLLGLTDTAVLGNFGSVEDLGAIALGAIIFNFVYWSFGFLRMGTTGFVAQADGASDTAEVRAILLRALLMALALGLALIVLRGPIASIAFTLLNAGPTVEQGAADYFAIRIWGAPATLAMFALMGVMIGLGKSRLVLVVQVVLNGLNIALDVWFAGVLKLGAVGIATGTLLAEWLALLVGLMLLVFTLLRELRDSEPFWVIARLRQWHKLRRLLVANADILIRTIALLFAFAWFTDRGAQFGVAQLAANHLLLQIIFFSAFFLDGFAYVAESLVGKAVGSGSQARFDEAVRRTTELAFATALLLALGSYLAGATIVGWLTSIDEVRAAATGLLGLAALYVVLSFGAFQLDGIFIGATRTAALRNAALVSAVGFLASDYLLQPLGVEGLWLAMILFVCYRALGLLYYFPALRQSVASRTDGDSSVVR